MLYLPQKSNDFRMPPSGRGEGHIVAGGACVCDNRLGVATSKIPAVAFSFRHASRDTSLPEGGYGYPSSATHDGKDSGAKAVATEASTFGRGGGVADGEGKKRRTTSPHRPRVSS